jgi:hypothetical protein
LTNWTPFRFAARLRSLQQGSLNVGNTRQNLVNLKNLAIANAQTNGGRGGWARWRVGFGTLGGSLGTSTTSTAGLLINVPAVPGYIAPGVSHILDESGNFVNDQSGNRIIAG